MIDPPARFGWRWKRRVRHALELVFDLFGKLRSVRGVLNYLVREGVELPSETSVPGMGRLLRWQAPRYHAIYQFLIRLLDYAQF